MAIYHCSIKNIGRSSGKSAVASSAYRSGEKLHDEELGKTFDYTSKDNVVYSEIILCKNAPKEYQDRQKLWNEVQKAEKAKDARLAREWEVALPNELPLEKAKELARGYAQSLADEGMCVDYAIHWKDGNHHAHIMGTTRAIKENGEWAQKTRKVYDLDENGQKIPLIDKKTGEQKVDKQNRKQWKSHKDDYTDWNKTEKVEEWRERWAEHCNRYLEKEQQINHRSYERQDIEQIPTIHEGYVARQMEKRGEISERCQYNRDVLAINQALKKLSLEISENKAFVEVLKETDSRLNDLVSVGDKYSYNFACDAIERIIEQDRRVPVLLNQGDSVALAEEKEPSKALERLRNTKEAWNNFITKCREKLSEVQISAKEEKPDISTREYEKPSTSLFERFKGYVNDKMQERAEKKAIELEQKQKMAEELRKKLEERERIEKILQEEVYRYDDEACIEQIRAISDIYHKTDDIYIKDKCIEKLGQITGLKTQQYNPSLDTYETLTSRDISPRDVQNAVNTAIERRMGQLAENERRRESMAKFRAIQEQNRDKIADRQRARQERNKDATSKGRDR